MLSNDIIYNKIAKEAVFTHLTVEGDGYHYYITASSDLFKGMSKVARQQWFYSILNNYIISGSLHAISIKAYTVSEWSALNG